MLELVPASAFSERYRIERDGLVLAEFKLGWLREGGKVLIDGAPHDLQREGTFSGAFLLTHGGTVVARASKPSAMRSRFEVEHEGRRYELDRATVWRRRFEVRLDGQTVGGITPRNAFTRRAEITLPPDLALPVKTFLAALVALMWRRDAAAAAG